MATPSYLAKSQFVGDIHLLFGNYEDFNDFAVNIEKKYLQKLLGFNHYYEIYIAGNKDQKYVNLRDGIEAGYEDRDGYQQELRGFKEMLKYFFYFHYVIEVQTERTLSGDPQEAYIKMVGGSKQSANVRLCNAWNTGVKYYNQLVDYMIITEDNTPDTYEDWVYDDTLTNINTFGIVE